MPPGIEESALERLQTSPYLALRGIRCEYREGVLRLLGQLPTHYLKQVAFETVAGMEGVTEVVNQIGVIPGNLEQAGGAGRPG